MFTLGYKAGIAGGWQRMNRRFGIIMDIGKGVFLVTIIEFFILEGIKSYVEIHLGKRLSFLDSKQWVIAIVIAYSLYLPNYYILVTLGHGIKFEREFNSLKKNRKMLLVVSFVLLLLATMAFCIYSDSAYRHFFHIYS
jgi:hypothetical protein